MRVAVFGSIFLLLSLLSTRVSVAQPAELRSQIAALVDEAALGDRVGIVVSDVATGRILFESHGSLPLNPASNQKLVTAAAALLELGPDYRIPTGLYGRVDENGTVPVLVIKSHGDPSLRMSDLVELASMALDRGVRRVSAVQVDASFFDDQRLPPAFEQQPNEAAAFRAAVSAVAIEGSSFLLGVLPGAAGERPIIRLDAPGYFELDNQMTTSEGGSPNVVVIQRDRDDGRMDLLLRGSIPSSQSRGVSYRRRVENPSVHAGYSLVAAFRRLGIEVGNVVSMGSADGLPLLASRMSPPMSELLYRVGKYSDNFVAEMVLKILGAEEQRPGTSERGIAVLRSVLAASGANMDRIRLVNGSGLFDGNQIAPHDIVTLLRFMYRETSVRPEYLAQLAIGGTDGTLHRRLRNLPRARIVRAKTGTLNDVIALSGYVLGPTPERAVAFSFLANGIRGRQGAARELSDQIVTAIARDLYRE